MGRTQLQDAVPMTVGQEFKAFSVLLDEEVRNLTRTAEYLLEVNLGATAIGTGLNTPKGYAPLAVKYLSEVTGLPCVLAEKLNRSYLGLWGVCDGARCIKTYCGETIKSM